MQLNRRKNLSLPTLLVLRGSYSLLSLGFLILIAKTFGATARADLFFIAQVFPVIAGYQLKDALNLSFISTYSQVRVESGKSHSDQLANSCFYFVLITVTGFTLLYVLVAPGLLYRYSSLTSVPELLYVKLIVCLSPIIILLSLFGVLEGILYSHGCFLVSAVANLSFYGFGILFIWMFSHSLGILAPAVGLTLGCIIQFLVVLWGTARQFSLRNLLIPWRGRGAGGTFKLFLKRLWPTLYIMSFLQLAFIVQRLLAFFLGEGNISLITYSTRITFFLPFLMVNAIVIPSLSSITVSIAQNKRQTFRIQIREIAKTIIVLVVPAFIWLLFYREGLVRVLLERGMFSATDTSKLSILLLFALPGMLPAVFAAVYRQTLLAMNKIRQLMVSSTVSIGIGILLSFFFMQHLAVNGIALGVTLGIFLQFFLLNGILERESARLWILKDVILILKIGSLSAIAFVASYTLVSLLPVFSVERIGVSVFLNFTFYVSLYLFGAVKTKTIELVPVLNSLDRLTQHKDA